MKENLPVHETEVIITQLWLWRDFCKNELEHMLHCCEEHMDRKRYSQVSYTFLSYKHISLFPVSVCLNDLRSYNYWISIACGTGAMAGLYSDRATGWRTRVQFPAGTGISSPCHCIQTAFGAHPDNQICTRDSFPGGKIARVWRWPLTSIQSQD